MKKLIALIGAFATGSCHPELSAVQERQVRQLAREEAKHEMDARVAAVAEARAKAEAAEVARLDMTGDALEALTKKTDRDAAVALKNSTEPLPRQ